MSHASLCPAANSRPLTLGTCPKRRLSAPCSSLRWRCMASSSVAGGLGWNSGTALCPLRPVCKALPPWGARRPASVQREAESYEASGANSSPACRGSSDAASSLRFNVALQVDGAPKPSSPQGSAAAPAWDLWEGLYDTAWEGSEPTSAACLQGRQQV